MVKPERLMPSNLRPFSLKLPPETIRQIERIRKRLQTEQPGTIVSRADAVRHAIHSLSSSYIISPLSLDAEADEKSSGEKGSRKADA